MDDFFFGDLPHWAMNLAAAFNQVSSSTTGAARRYGVSV